MAPRLHRAAITKQQISKFYPHILAFTLMAGHVRPLADVNIR